MSVTAFSILSNLDLKKCQRYLKISSVNCQIQARAPHHLGIALNVLRQQDLYAAYTNRQHRGHISIQH